MRRLCSVFSVRGVLRKVMLEKIVLVKHQFVILHVQKVFTSIKFKILKYFNSVKEEFQQKCWVSGGAQVVTLQELAQTQADMPRLALLLTTRLSRKALVRFPVGEPGNVPKLQVLQYKSCRDCQ